MLRIRCFTITASQEAVGRGKSVKKCQHVAFFFTHFTHLVLLYCVLHVELEWCTLTLQPLTPDSFAKWFLTTLLHALFVCYASCTCLISATFSCIIHSKSCWNLDQQLDCYVYIAPFIQPIYHPVVMSINLMLLPVTLVRNRRPLFTNSEMLKTAK